MVELGLAIILFVATALGVALYVRGRKAAGALAVLIAIVSVILLWGRSGADAYLGEALLIGCAIPLGVVAGYLVGMRLNVRNRASDDDGTSVWH